MGRLRGAPLSEFAIKDSGARESFDSGMVRDTEDGKLDYSLVFDGPMFKRWAAHLTKGAQKYAPRNWMKASGEAEFERFKRSLLRHLVAYLEGDRDEDHAAAIIFNVNGMEYVREQRVVYKGEPSPAVIAGEYVRQDSELAPLLRLSGYTFDVRRDEWVRAA